MTTPALDAALASAPSRIAWRTVTECLDALCDEEASEHVAAIDARLAAWPDRFRTVPGRWLRTLLDGNDEPRLAVTRTFDHVLAREPERRARFAWTQTRRLARLVVMRLHDEGFGDEGAHALAVSSNLEALVELSIGGHIGPEGLAQLVGCPFLRTVRTLGLNRNRIGVAGVQSVVASPHLESLEALHLGRNALDDESVEALAAARMPRLSRLDLDFNAFTARGLRALLASPFLATVRELNLSNNVMSPESCEALAACPYLEGLRILFLHNCSLTDDALDVLVASPHLCALGNLALSENQLGMRSFRALAEWGALGGLYELDVCHNRVDPVTVEACLRGSTHLRGVARLCV